MGTMTTNHRRARLWRLVACTTVLLGLGVGVAAAAPPEGKGGGKGKDKGKPTVPEDPGPEDPPPPPPPPTVPDPAEYGPFTPLKADYDEGLTLVTDTATGLTYPASLKGVVHYPAQGTGPFPVLVFEHGRHSTCDLTVTEFLGYPCPEVGVLGTQVVSNIDSFRGYDYLAANLASHGYVVASFDVNSVNTFDSTGSNGMPERAQLIAETLGLLQGWGDGSRPEGLGPALVDRIDMERIGIMGHSRGGEGVATFVEYNRTLDQPFSLDAVFALAAVDFDDPTTDGVHFGALLPLCDGDVSNLQGAQAYDRSTYADPGSPFARVQFSVRGTNHNFFNTIWTNDDFGSSSDSVCNLVTEGSERLAPSDQRKLGVATMAPFLRRYVGGETAFDPFLDGRVPVAESACPTARAVPVPCDQLVGVSYTGPATTRTVLLQPEVPSAAVATAIGFASTSVCDPDGGTACPGLNRSGIAQQTLTWDGPATLSLDLTGTTLVPGADALTLRTLVNDADASTASSVAPNVVDFTIRFVTVGGVVEVAASEVGAFALTDTRGDRFDQETLDGLVVPFAALGVDPAGLQRVELVFGGATPSGSIQLAEVLVRADPTA